MSKQSVAVRIAGHNYKILSDGDADALRDIARYVDAAMDRVRQRTGTVDTLDISVLTCLNLAREILSLRGQKTGGVEDARLRTLIERVEIALGNGSASTSSDDEASADADGSPHRKRASTSETPSAEPSRTLDLPSVEALRDRASAASDAEADEMPEARVASGGRERVS